MFFLVVVDRHVCLHWSLETFKTTMSLLICTVRRQKKRQCGLARLTQTSSLCLGGSAVPSSHQLMKLAKSAFPKLCFPTQDSSPTNSQCQCRQQQNNTTSKWKFKKRSVENQESWKNILLRDELLIAGFQKVAVGHVCERVQKYFEIYQRTIGNNVVTHSVSIKSVEKYQCYKQQPICSSQHNSCY